MVLSFRKSGRRKGKKFFKVFFVVKIRGCADFLIEAAIDYFALLSSNFLKEEPPPARGLLVKANIYFTPFLLVSNWPTERHTLTLKWKRPNYLNSKLTFTSVEIRRREEAISKREPR